MMNSWTVSIGEPWDFSSPDGLNRMCGDIIKVIDSHCLVFETPYQLEFKGKRGCKFVMFTRNDSFEFLGKKDVIVNVGLFGGSDVSGKSAEELEHESTFVMIGSIKASG